VGLGVRTHHVNDFGKWVRNDVLSERTSFVHSIIAISLFLVHKVLQRLLLALPIKVLRILCV